MPKGVEHLHLFNGHAPHEPPARVSFASRALTVVLAVGAALAVIVVVWALLGVVAVRGP